MDKEEIDFQIKLSKNGCNYISALFLYGILTALQEKVMSVDDAEKLMLLPKYHSLAKNLNLHKNLIESISDGFDFDGILALVPEHLDEAIDAIKLKVKDIISKVDFSNSYMELEYDKKNIEKSVVVIREVEA